MCSFVLMMIWGRISQITSQSTKEQTVLRQNNYSGVKKSTPPSKSAEDHLQESGTDSEKTKLKLFLFNGDANFSGIETDAQSVKERYVFF